MPGINVTKGLTYFIRWDMMLMACLRNSMPFKPERIPKKPPIKTLNVIANSLIKSVSPTIGTAKCAPAIRNITNGHNGHSFSYSNRGIIKKPVKQNRLLNLSNILKNTEMQESKLLLILWNRSRLRNGTEWTKSNSRKC